MAVGVPEGGLANMLMHEGGAVLTGAFWEAPATPSRGPLLGIWAVVALAGGHFKRGGCLKGAWRICSSTRVVLFLTETHGRAQQPHLRALGRAGRRWWRSLGDI